MFLCKIKTPIFQLQWNSSDSDLTTPAKNRKKNEYKRFEFSDQKVYGFGLQAGLKLAFKINYTMPGFLRNLNIQMTTVCLGESQCARMDLNKKDLT